MRTDPEFPTLVLKVHYCSSAIPALPTADYLDGVCPDTISDEVAEDKVNWCLAATDWLNTPDKGGKQSGQWA